MKPFYRLFCAVLLFFATTSLHAQIVLNEICPSNISIIQNDDGDYDDWIEIYNASGGDVNLQGYGLSDDANDLYQFTFPSVTLNAGSRMLVFCSDRDQTEIVNHWETPILGTSSWKYFVGTANPDTNWR